ncbi:putative baseplate assembly protein [Tumebacillus sp. DT12]|uniref:Baseplate assembly protein n=1 Tax=Tumebacillus lacus TaxID=2995335 RepID=A0ABT3X394_9BACL|nr:putative baseplate assembly protein [Tumebacillus lacus]MCX7570277.1 putative baseplate assembly protein [Tumebacillus lacus]
MQQPPRIDNRTLGDLVEQMKEMVPHYTPEWRFSPEEPDPGTALFFLFAEMFLQNAERLNRVPMKNRIAFLNLLDVTQQGAKAARSHVTFAPSVGAKGAVLIPAGTRIAALDPDGGDDDILFETEQSMLVTPAAISALWQVSPARDVITEMPGLPLTTPVRLFDLAAATNRQEHALYIGHDDLFLVDGPAEFEIVLRHTTARYLERSLGAVFANPEHIEWLYSTDEGWEPFDQVISDENRLTLRKRGQTPLALREIDGQTRRWVQGRVKPGKLPRMLADHESLLLNGVRVKAASLDLDGRGGSAPDVLFFNDTEVEAKSCYPFGEFFAPYGVFYIASREALSKKGAEVELTFRLQAERKRLIEEEEPPIRFKWVMREEEFERKKVPEASIRTVHWEYWNGTAWVRLTGESEAEELFYKPGEESAREQTVRFICPEDLAETFVNGVFQHWIRARVDQIDNLYANNPIYLTPKIQDLRLAYRSVEGVAVETLLTQNNMEWVDQTMPAKREQALFQPFYGPGHKHPALYLGFAVPPQKGPIRLYVSLEAQEFTGATPVWDWEYLRRDGAAFKWERLKVIDETLGFSRSGTVQFVGPSDLTHSTLFQQDLYWLRAVNRDDAVERRPLTALPLIEGLHLNTVSVVQQDSVRGETPGLVLRDGAEQYVLTRTPVLGEEIWVEETGEISEREVAALEAEDASGVRVVRDSEEQVIRVDVRWSPVETFDESGPEDRHYLINRTTGRFAFGDGTHGKKPKPLPERITVDYKVIAGRRGNVEANAITELQKSIAFIDHVRNPIPAIGGGDREPLEQAMARGPQLVRHRGKGVTVEDFEWLARQAYPDLAKVKCLKGYNARMEKVPGHIALVLLSKSGPGHLRSFREMKGAVLSYLEARIPNTILGTGRLQVIEPCYLEISIHAHLIARTMDEVVPAEQEALDRLTRFLHPIRGNHDGKGWEIGQPLHVSAFYALLKSVTGIRQVKSLAMTVHKVEGDARTELHVEQVAQLPHGIVVSGAHRVTVDL